MTTAEHSKNSNSPPTPKKPSRSWIKKLVPACVLAALIGTYLDLYFAGKGFYSFPMRPFPEIFSIHIGFNLVGLPLMVGVFLLICNQLPTIGKALLIFLLSLIMSIFERFAESIGFLVHTDDWKHIYSFLGYFLFLIFILVFYKWMNHD